LLVVVEDKQIVVVMDLVEQVLEDIEQGQEFQLDPEHLMLLQ
jgi:hypothetical protein